MHKRTYTCLLLNMAISGGSRISKRGGGQGRAPKAQGLRRRVAERRKRKYRGAEAVGFEEGVSPPQWRKGLGRGQCPLPRKLFDFESEKGDF